MRSALGTQTTPPNQVMVGLALFLTLFIMSPVISDVNENCVQPFQQGELTQEEALNAGLKPIRAFMFKQTNRSDIRLFLDIEGEDRDIESEEDIPTMVLMPAFVISELRTAFTILFIQSRTPTHRMVPLTFRMGLPYLHSHTRSVFP